MHQEYRISRQGMKARVFAIAIITVLIGALSLSGCARNAGEDTVEYRFRDCEWTMNTTGIAPEGFALDESKTQFAENNAPWSEWSHQMPSDDGLKDIETQISGYHMVQYVTREASSKLRHFRDFSVRSNLGGLGLDTGYGEGHRDIEIDKATYEAAPKVAVGEYYDGGNYAQGYNSGNGEAVVLTVNDELSNWKPILTQLFVAGEISEYRYRAASSGNEEATYYYYRWGAYSEWNETQMSPNENREVQTRTLHADGTATEPVTLTFLEGGVGANGEGSTYVLDVDVGWSYPPNDIRYGNQSILSPIGCLVSDVVKDNPTYVRLNVSDDWDGGNLCIGDPSAGYAYIFTHGNTIPYDLAISEITEIGIKCAGIVTTVGVLFPNMPDGTDPIEYFNGKDINDFDAGLNTSIGSESDAQGYVCFTFRGLKYSISRVYRDSSAPSYYLIGKDDQIYVMLDAVYDSNNKLLVDWFYSGGPFAKSTSITDMDGDMNGDGIATAEEAEALVIRFEKSIGMVDTQILVTKYTDGVGQNSYPVYSVTTNNGVYAVGTDIDRGGKVTILWAEMQDEMLSSVSHNESGKPVPPPIDEFQVRWCVTEYDKAHGITNNEIKDIAIDAGPAPERAPYFRVTTTRGLYIVDGHTGEVTAPS